jgi:gluconate kinase
MNLPQTTKEQLFTSFLRKTRTLIEERLARNRDNDLMKIMLESQLELLNHIWAAYDISNQKDVEGLESLK